MAKAPETSVHLKIPTAAIKAIDWLVENRNSEMTRYPKITRSDLIKTEITRLAARATEEREDVARAEAKRAADAEAEKAALAKKGATKKGATKSRKVVLR